MKVLGFKELFIDVEVNDQYPIERFAENVPALFSEKTEYCIDFSGIEPLTDEVFFVLDSLLNDDQKQHVLEIRLLGCAYLTDRGIRILAGSFTRLKKINLAGCKQLTEKSLFYLRNTCKELQYINMEATSLATVPLGLGQIPFSYDGSPVYLNHNDDCGEIDTETCGPHADINLPVNLVIMAFENITIDIGNLLITGNELPIGSHEQILFKEKAFKIGQIDINIIELHCNPGYFSPFLTERSLFMIVVNLDSTENAQLLVVKGIDFIRGVVHQAPITVVGLVSAKSTSMLEDLDGSLKAIFKDQLINMEEHLDKEHFSRSADKDFPHQWRYVQSVEANRPENFPIYLVGLDWNQSNLKNWQYFSAIREVSVQNEILKMTSKWMNDEMMEAKDALDRLNSADFSECKSLTVWSKQLTVVFHCVLIILKAPIGVEIIDSAKMMLNDHRFILRLQHFYETLDEHDPKEVVGKLYEIVKEDVDMNKITLQSKLGGALWIWVKAIWNYYEHIGPLTYKAKEEAQAEVDQKQASQPLEILKFRLSQNLLHLTTSMYQWKPNVFDKKLLQFKSSLPFSRKILTLRELVSSLGETGVYGMSLDVYSKALELLTNTGALVYFSKHPNRLVVLDIDWFVSVLNHLFVEWKEPLNGDRVWCLDREAVVATKEEFSNFFETHMNHEESNHFFALLVDMGMIMRVTAFDTIPKGPSEANPQTLFASWHHVQKVPSMRVSSSEDAPQKSVRKFLVKYFPEVNSPDYNPSDVNFKFSFKFRIGMPCNLFPKIVATCLKKLRVISIWDQGVFLRHGVVDIMIRHNFHGTMASSSIDLEARTNRPPGNYAILREYMWSVISDYLTVIETIIIEFPYTHHKLRYYCRGECYQELAKENTFSPAEVARSLDRNVSCSKCKNYQMINEEWLFLLGRQYIFPAHDYQQSSCKYCWRWLTDIGMLWKMQCRIFPAFANLCFAPTYPNGPLLGNVLCGVPANDDTAMSVRSIRPLKKHEFDHLEVTCLDPKDVELSVVDSDVRILISSRFDKGTWHVDESLTFSKGQPSLKTLSVARGDRIGLNLTTEKNIFNEDEETSCHELAISLNGCIIEEILIPEKCFIQLAVTSNVDSVTPKAIIECSSFPVITARYFQPGMIVLFKTGVGATWSPGLVHKIERGLLFIHDVDNPENAGKFYHPNSADLCPVGLYPDEINAIVDKKHLKGFESWYNFLEKRPTYFAAPFGLFTRVVDKPQYVPLPQLQAGSRVCTGQIHHPCNYLRAFFSERSTWSISPVLLLPREMQQEFVFMSNRIVAQKMDNQSLYPLCKGSSWRPNLSDLHVMNIDPKSLSSDECEFLLSDFITHLLLVFRVSSSRTMLMHFQEYDKCFPLIESGINNKALREGVMRMVKVYRDSLLLRQVMLLPGCHTNILHRSGPRGTAATVANAARTVLSRKRSEMHRRASKLEDASSLAAARAQKFKQITSQLRGRGYLCESHTLIKDITKHDVHDLGHYAACIGNVKLSKKNVKTSETKEISEFPSPSILSCVNLTHIEVSDFGLTETEWVSKIPQLVALQLPNNLIKCLSEELLEVKKSLRFLILNNNPLEKLPDFVCELTKIETLELNNTLVKVLPEEIGELEKLRNLTLEKSLVSQLPGSFSKLKNLQLLKITGLTDPLAKKKYTRNEMLSFKNWEMFVSDTHVSGFAYSLLSSEEVEECFEKFDEEKSKMLSYEQLKSFTYYLFTRFPRLCLENTEDFPKEILGCSSLRTLVLSYQGIKSIPDGIERLQNLEKLVLDNCPYLETVSGQICKTKLHVLSLQECHAVRTPPIEIRRQGMNATIAYLKRLATGSTSCYRTKLMFVGLGGAGKTSLMRALMSENFRAPPIEGDGITDGIDINTWTISRAGEPPITYSVWDFAGQTLYYNTHQFFLTGRAIYLLVWNIRQGYEHAGLQFWLNSVTCHAPKAPIFIVGTHADQVSKSEAPVEEIMRRYPSVVKFCYVSSYTGQGVENMLEDIISVTKQQPYIGEQIPEAWLTFEQAILGKRRKKDYMKWKSIQKLATGNAIYESEVKQAIQFLHNLGSIQHFDTDLLRDNIIINSQWLVDVMASLVSVHNSVIKDGRLEHKDIALVWKNYSKDMHEWLLRLTEIFDLTFSMPEAKINIVPCLLPRKQPEFEWEDARKLARGTREAKMFYLFDYLPEGFFNRAQVRLCQFSESSIIWQRGSLLVKNEHRALITREGENKVVVRVQGQRPENFILLVHEVFESLAEEAFSGVMYEYMLPCNKCTKEQVTEPHLFSSNILHRAVEMKAMFLQCHNQFHCLSVTELQGVMPPESITDYDLQFERSMSDLLAVEQDLTTNVMLIYAKEDVPTSDEDEFHPHPRQLCNDLKKMGISVWYSPDLESEEFSELITAMTHTQIVAHHISSKFVVNERCRELFDLAEVLQKPIRLLVVGEGKDWQKSDIGMKVTGDKYVNFQRKSQYDHKINELAEDLRANVVTSQTKVGLGAAKVFISYCWDNSLLAVESGDCKRRQESALGFGDPRQMKQFLEQNEMPCWLDIERVGANGLYTEICAGLKSCDLVVACVSDEYALSDTCRREFLFAHRTLNKPIVLALVGTGNMWESSEIGFLALDYTKVDFRVANNIAENMLLQVLQKELEKVNLNESEIVQSEHAYKQIQNQAFQEQYELVQRKLFRLLCSYVDEADHYPRLMVVDFFQPEVLESQSDSLSIGDINEDEDGDEDSETANTAEFCFKVLCEFEGGWHCDHDGYPISLLGIEMEEFLKLAAPYLARISILLKHNNTDLQFVRNLVDGERILTSIEENARGWHEVKAVYCLLRECVMSLDSDKTCGFLKRCHMPSGKSLWLCKKHQKLPRVAVLSSEERDNSLPVSINSNAMTDRDLLQRLTSLKATEQDEGQTESIPVGHTAAHMSSQHVAQPASITFPKMHEASGETTLSDKTDTVIKPKQEKTQQTNSTMDRSKSFYVPSDDLFIKGNRDQRRPHSAPLSSRNESRSCVLL